MSDRSKLKEKVNRSGVTPRPLVLQRKCACGNHTVAGEKCESCSKTDSINLQRSATNDEPLGTTPPIVGEVLQSTGQSLENETRGFFESRFNHDFSRVRVHSDKKASDSADAVNASAYTVGRDIVFGTGQYSPGTLAGRELLAHELAHTVQQGEQTAATSSALPVS